MMRKTVTPDFTLSASLDEEMAHGDHLIEVLKLAARSLDHERHTIAVLGTQITVGDVIDGALARHAARRNTAEED